MSGKRSGCAHRWRRRTERFTRPKGRRSEGWFTVGITDFDGGGLFVLVESDGVLMRGDEFKSRVLGLNRKEVTDERANQDD